MTRNEATREILKLFAAWPSGRAGSDEPCVTALRKAVRPYCSLKHVPENELPKIVKRFQAISENARIHFARPNPNGAASLMLS